jgi:hypothetical protein
MKDKLIFTPAFEEHLDKILEPWGSSSAVKKALVFCYDLEVEEIELSTYGEGDEGGYTDIAVKPSKLYTNIPSDVRDSLEEYGAMIAEVLNPGYEINEGGGCHCTISFSPFSIKAEVYTNEIVQKIIDTFTVV